MEAILRDNFEVNFRENCEDDFAFHFGNNFKDNLGDIFDDKLRSIFFQSNNVLVCNDNAPLFSFALIPSGFGLFSLFS